MGAAVATTNCGAQVSAPNGSQSGGQSGSQSGSQNMVPMYGASGVPFPQPSYGAAVMPIETDDSSTPDGPNEAAPDAADASTDTQPTDSGEDSPSVSMFLPYGTPPPPIESDN